MPKEQLKTAEQLLAMPRPNTQPPKPPQPNYNDQQFDDWGKEYDAWVEENKHLPNLQPSAQIIERMKANIFFSKCQKTDGAMVTIKWQTKDLINL